MQEITINSPLGLLGIHIENEGISRVQFLEDGVQLRSPRDRFSLEIVRQLDAYFSDANFVFSVPVFLSGTVFQQKVWDILKTIPYGQTITYSQLAEKAKSGARAVGNACRVNPIPIIIPCHRVVSTNGTGGYSGQIKGKYIDYKRWLLRHEGIYVA